MLSDDGKTVVGNNILEKITTYNLKTGLYSEQSNNCQLPHKVQTRWRLRNDATRSRSEQVASTYDDYGNLLTHQAANGVVETSLWYKAEEDGYPGDPEGFVKHLKQKIVTPAENLPGAAPTLVTTYRYERFPVLASSAAESGQGHWLALQSETLAGERELNTIHYSYYVQEQESPGPDEPMTHGRVRSRTSAFPLTTKAADVQGATLDTCAEYTYQYKTIDWDSLVALATSDSRGEKRAPEWFEATRMLYTQRQITGFDSTCKTTAQGVSLTTGEVLLDLDEDNVARITQFDSLGRMVCQIVAPGSASEATRSERYHLCANEQEQADQRSTDSLGVTVTQHFDGVGRVVQETRDHLDPAQPKRQLPILSHRYDAWGRELAVSQHDWLDGQAYPAPGQLQTTEYRYDAWGERSLILRADGVQEHVSFDPTETDKDNNVFKTRWLQAPRQTLKSEKVRTTINVFEKPLLIERLGLDDTPQAAQKLSYDGLGRCISKTDERGNTTRLEYDAFDRMTANVLPDDGRIEWQYAAHSGAQLPVSIVVISNTGSLPRYQVGSQTFDGLDRLTSRKVGKRLEQLLHTSAQSAPVSMTTGAGDSVGFTYKLELSPLPVSSSAIDDHAVFEYHPITSLLTKSMNAQGQREYEYDLSNHLTFEHWSNLGGDRLTTAYSTSFQGRLAERMDAGAAVTTHRYDELGRTKAIEQGNVVAGFDYDSLGRLFKVVCTDQANDSALTTDLAYDEHGRECQRTQQLDGQPARILMQTWGNDGLLDARELKEGGTTLHKEQFLYDVRGRLRTVNYSGLLLPEDNEGRSVVKQVFRFDALDNVTTAMTTFADATSATTVYTYDEHDRCQLAGLTVTQADQTTIELSFSHDANGNLQIDEQGRELRYDSQNRLLEIEPSSRYRYDGLGQLVASSAGGDQESLLWFDGEQLSLAMKGATATRYCRLQDVPLAQQTHDPAATLLLQTSASHSVIAESNAGLVRSTTYLAHGQRDGASLLDSHLGFNGEALDAGSGWYLLGNGYRAYNPALMRFTSPDSESPFDTGGLNPYVYCLGNPVTLRDPTGHSASAGGRPRRPDEDDPSWLGRRPGGGDTLKWVWLGVAVVATIAAVVTAGASLAAVGAFGAAAAASVAAAGTSVAAGAQVGLGTALLAKFAGTTLTAALMSTATAALAVAGTGAQAVAAISNDQTAGAWAGYLGLASIGLGVVNGLRSAGGALVGRFLARGGPNSVAASVGLPGTPRGIVDASDLGDAARPSFLHGKWAQDMRFQRIRSQFQQRRWLNHLKEGHLPNRFRR
ncbi:RHS repeat-associated core domain-containing protein [Pseudomonas sp.]|uniref:RHS repeat-associated core domain-containing protein n=1 Tax=Pseudomonas sp. TaxID=306 RepID=UPI0028AAC3D1|nr:RHS repeat-associated core domain-containing protein [Pseudomonas sp.]